MEENQQAKATITRSIPGDSPWFDGHFTGNPILPGIAQLTLVVEALEEMLGRKVVVAKVSRVKFKMAVRPGDPITVSVAPKAMLTYTFQVSIGDEPAASGHLTIAG